MITPKFWYENNSIVSIFLIPLSLLWITSSFILKLLKKKYYFKIPIICIGNAIAGGAGKTPLIIEICKYYKKKKLNTHVVYKAYKEKIHKKVIKISDKKMPINIEDEAQLISKHATTTWICKSRKDGVNAAIKAGAKLVLLDDGFQDHTINKTLNILVSNEKQGNGNGRVIPAGPLREKLYLSIMRSNCMFFYGHRGNVLKLFPNYEKHIFFAKTKPMKHIKYFSNKKVIAFAGIAHPENFFNMLDKHRVKIIKKISFSDHHRYSRKEILKILTLSEENSAKVLTTKKDYVKIPKELKKYIFAIDLVIDFDKKNFFNYLNKVLKENEKKYS